MNSLSLEEWRMWKLLDILVQLDENSNLDEESHRLALSDIFEEFEGYYGYKTEIEEFVFNEDGEIADPSIEEYNDFIFYISRKILKTLVENTKMGRKIHQEGFDEGEYYTTIFYTEKDDDYNY